MFEIGWTELLIVAVVAILVVGPKDLPRLLRAVGQFVSKGRRMAGEFQNQFNAALREAEREIDIEEARKTVADVKALNPLEGVKKALDPIRTAGEDLKRDIRSIGNPATAPSATPAAVTTGASAAAAATAGPAAHAAPAGAEPPVSTPRPVDVPAPTIVPPAEPPSFAAPAAPPAPVAPAPEAPATEMAPPTPQSPTAAPTPAAPIKTGPAGEGA